MALIFAERLMPRYFRQSLIKGPKILCFNNQFSNRTDDFENAHAATKIFTVVGIPGTNTPMNPNPTKKKPIPR